MRRLVLLLWVLAGASMWGAEAASAKELLPKDGDTLVAWLADDARRPRHAEVALQLIEIDDVPASATKALLALARAKDPVERACAVHALGYVGTPSAEVLDALGIAAMFAADAPPPPDTTGWARIEGRCFGQAFVPRGHGGWTRYLVFRSVGGMRLVHDLLLTEPPPPPPRPQRPPPPSKSLWTVRTHLLAVQSSTPLRMLQVGSKPPQTWQLEPDGNRVVFTPARRPRQVAQARRSGSLADLVTSSVQGAVVRLLGRGDASLMRKALTHEKAEVRRAAIAALRVTADPKPYARELFDLLLTDKSRQLERVFRRVGAEAGPVLRDAIRGKDLRRAGVALSWISRLRGDAGAAAVAVAERIDDPAGLEINSLFEAVKSMGAQAAPATDALRRFIREKRLHYELALDAIGSIGPAAKPAVPDLVAIARARAGFGHGRLRATLALRAIEPTHPELVDFFVGCLTDANSNVIALALLHVPRWRPVDPRIREAVRKATHHKEAAIRRDAVRMLEQIQQG